MSIEALLDQQLRDQALRHGLTHYEPKREAHLILGDERDDERRIEAERSRDEISMIAGLRSASPAKEFDIGAAVVAGAMAPRSVVLLHQRLCITVVWIS